MSTGDWFYITLAILMAVTIVGVIVECRRGKRSVAMTVGIILLFFGATIDKALPILVPSLASLADKLSDISIIGGLLIIIGTWWVERRRKEEVS